MAQETEIKLRISPDAMNALRTHPLLTERRQGDWQTGTLYNQYYDTASRDLAAARVALRVRRDGDQFIQTLKSSGQDRKSTRLNASHVKISYAVVCSRKK